MPQSWVANWISKEKSGDFWLTVPYFGEGGICVSWLFFGPQCPFFVLMPQSPVANWISNKKSGDFWLKVPFVNYTLFRGEGGGPGGRGAGRPGVSVSRPFLDDLH